MDVSQQSLTQDNDDRDYENYYEGPSFVATSPASQDVASENHTRDDDSPVVAFGSLSHLIHADTQADEEPSSIPDDAAPKHVRGEWRNRTSSSQQHSSVQHPDGQSPMLPANSYPQTPANRHNPFAGKKMGDPALAGSQLFGQTQFSSGVKHFSPTSSRPSPNVYAHNSISPNIIETSPLKNRHTVTSPPTLLSSSPQGVRVDHQAPNDRERSPSDSGPPEDGTVPESPQLVPILSKAGLEPIEKYESMLDSQKRKMRNTATEGGASVEDSDEEARKRERRRRVESKKKEADKELTSIPIPIGRPKSRDLVGIPSNTKKSRKLQTTASRGRTRRIPDDSTESENEADEFTVADSQDQGQAAAQPAETRDSPDLADKPLRAKPGFVSSNDAVPDSAAATQKSVSNGVIPGTESSGNSSRPKDLIPETSPNNTQSRPTPKRRSSSYEPVPVKKADTEESPAPAALPKEPDADVEIMPDTPQSSLTQPSRRSSRKSKPTLKAQCLIISARPTVSSEPEPLGTGESEAPGADVSAQSDAPDELVTDKKGAATRTEPISVRVEVPAVDETPPLPSSPPLPKAQVGDAVSLGSRLRENSVEQNPSTPSEGDRAAAPDAPGSTTSTLTVLTVTPVQSDKTSPATPESVELPHLSPDRPTRGRQPTKSLPRPTTGSRVAKPGTRTRKPSRRAARLDSASTDELTRSPSVNGFENSIIHPPKVTARSSRLSMLSHASKDNVGKPSIFAGMAFAISFQSKKDGEKSDQYENRLGQSREVEKMIVQSGGHLLGNGFDELFEPNALGSRATSPASEVRDDSPLTLTPFAQTMGFTALIADGHSRKVKYMQALALGLPCISDRWVVTCVAKGAVVDWLPYLLCAGQSTFLRDAIRSRYLPPYSAIDARLVDIIERRPKMLEGSKILLVMKKSRAEEKKMPYVFLAHVLGATLSRAYSVDEAKETLRHRELLGDPFDWVYVDEHTGSEEGLFSPDYQPTKGSKTSKKRKRANPPAAKEAARAPKRIRTLSNELVIQSLILGRMIEEGELEA
ncbi:UbiD family decarboxylase [Colletotrichum graminicola M1.001]|uniref:UbiD family decarboxylase n=1 Tax=Colletotrichum graminicola (strain M1.001 / M2 / FGSC 10212) TaxID=645133 RepID=E3QZ61_COLGM|nr:UbiD family decarboxylase [Colletotrichum graminicola M1.001]EFQ36149.1 UbiD family decarboxylase [Colletotrichum graminicola M1.001]